MGMYGYMNSGVRDLDNRQLSCECKGMHRFMIIEITSFSIFLTVIVSWTEIVQKN